MNVPPSLFDTLVENAKYMPADEVNNGNPQKEESSACELKCKEQQAALVSCMESIRQGNEENQQSVNKQCLLPSVAAWTDCCSKANNDV